MNEIDNLLDIARRRLDEAAFAWKSREGRAQDCHDEFDALYIATKRLHTEFIVKLDEWSTK